MKRHLIALFCLSLFSGCILPNDGGNTTAPAPETPEPAQAPAPAPTPAAAPEPAPAPQAAAPADPFPSLVNPEAGKMATNYPPIVTEAYAQVELKDGVDGDEAAILADAYFMGYVTGNGMIGEISDRGDTWEFETFVEYSRTPYKPIQVSKKNGRITCGGGPIVDPPPGPQG